MLLADRLEVPWITERRLQVVEVMGTSPILLGWYVFAGGAAEEGFAVFVSTTFGATLLLFSVLGGFPAVTVAITSVVRYVTSDLAVHRLDAIFAGVYLVGLGVFAGVITIAGTPRPTGVADSIALVGVFGAVLSVVPLSVLVFSRPIVTMIDTESVNA